MFIAFGTLDLQVVEDVLPNALRGAREAGHVNLDDVIGVLHREHLQLVPKFSIAPLVNLNSVLARVPYDVNKQKRLHFGWSFGCRVFLLCCLCFFTLLCYFFGVKWGLQIDGLPPVVGLGNYEALCEHRGGFVIRKGYLCKVFDLLVLLGVLH